MINNKKNVLYLCGVLDYADSVSGNYYIYKILAELKNIINLKCIGIWNMIQNVDYDRNDFLGITGPLKSCDLSTLENILPQHDVLILASDDLTNDQIAFIKNKYKCDIYMILMTSWVLGSSPYPEFDGCFDDQKTKERFQTYKDCDVSLIHVSTYSKKIQSKSLFKDLKSHVIPLPFDNFHKTEKKLKQNKDTKDILWATMSPDSRRKGKKEFEMILDLLKQKHPELSNITIHTAGPIPNIATDYKVVNHGILPRNKMADLFSYCDVFALTTLADSGPMVALESIVNGTPVVSYDTNITSDITNNGINGYVVKDDEDFVNKIYEILKFKKYTIDHDYAKKFNSLGAVKYQYLKLLSHKKI